jgi:hypothetical protein
METKNRYLNVNELLPSELGTVSVLGAALCTCISEYKLDIFFDFYSLLYVKINTLPFTVELKGIFSFF